MRRYEQLAFRAAYLVTRSAQEAEDATQEGFVKAWKAIGRFDTDRPFRPWVLRIVTNEARNRKRSAGRREHLALRAIDPEHESDPSVAAVTADERSRVLAAVEQLDEGDRLVIVFRYFLDLSEREMADAMDVPAGTVKSRLNRARRRLEAVLTATGAR